jgi:hypothetical protein
MQPAAAEIEDNAGGGDNGVGASTDPVAGFEHDDGEAGAFQCIGRAQPSGAGSDNGDIDIGGEISRHRNTDYCFGSFALSA